ncbi:LacI family DNA-binding transcriptional regulator [Brachybacterium sp. YJGR34]|uniref:LacI family DNA-binding transcriptional regulator n=1 Tax=Brachybacterium sp. YJGR34 TaxID=2059911 RepID=UPI000E0B9C30|nr:LacI family DNA-binding transcriptional regulator [Brachybacterium sp. YJGR34]
MSTRTPGSGATIYQVAALAGVSIATVSRTFGSSESVAPRTREAVLAAARELHYVPTASARALAVRRSRALGVVLPHIDGAYYAELLVGFEVAASKLGLSIVLALERPGAARPSTLTDLLGRVDGVAFMARSGADDETVRRVAEVRPAVSVARGQVDGVDAFFSENRRTAQDMTEHLIGHGRRRIGFVGRPEAGSDIGQRHQGYLEALSDAGLRPARQWPVDPVEEAGVEVAGQLLADGGPGDLDALVCGNDELAAAIQDRLTAGGVEVPDRLALTGWDDTVTARYLRPGLTTVRQDVARLGGLAARRLAARIDGDPAQEAVTVGTSIILRGSCGCPPHDPAPPAGPGSP